jgi:hypothetical protein
VVAKSSEITVLLRAWSSGDEAARDRLAVKVYNELKWIARRYMKDERARVTLQTTALANEVYLRLVDTKNVDWQHRAQFFTMCANDAADSDRCRSRPGCHKTRRGRSQA